MKKIIVLFLLALAFNLGFTTSSIAQKDKKSDTLTELQASQAEAYSNAENSKIVEVSADNKTFHQVLKEKFIEGGPIWMTPILIVFILGLAIVIERIIYLNLSSTNSIKLLTNIETNLKEKDIQAAKDICKNTRGPLAGIFYQGLDRYDEGLDIVEKSIIAYGGVLMARLEKNLSWIALFIALAPMLGFLGTVVGMVQAFEAIEKAGDISPTIVAGGMKVALLTTVFGLIVAIILQVFYNYLISKIESLVNTMEDASISFMDILLKVGHQKELK
ncbi:MAG: MotA/TolQ/ExbB proton channel family protein [Bacteroidetes bacterium]|nr:MotA/TolQ/ExbB proton channel family protein [Bacteroidota bacterium]